MDKLYRAIAVLFILAASSCTGYDDSDIRGGLSDLENRVSKLETLCSQMNSNIDALQTIVNALQQKEFIESVTPLADGQGYTLTFSSGKTVTIYNGKDGKDGVAGTDGKDGAAGKDGKDGVDGRDGSTPSLGIKQHTDGVWYWTVNGDWLHDSDGNMVKAVGTDGQDGDNGKDGADGKDGKDGVTPKLKIEDGMWYVSSDGGVSWELLGRATGEDGASAGIISVTEEDGYVRFGMQDGTVISIAKRQPLGISFSTDAVAISEGGESTSISYTLTGVSEQAVVKAVAQDGWKAKVNRTSFNSGTIEITSPEPLVESEILVFVSDCGHTVLAVINCARKITVIIPQDQYEVSAAGGDVEVPLQANADFSVSIPENAKLWLSSVQTKSMVSKVFTFTASANETPMARTAIVSVLDDSGVALRTFSIIQSGDMEKLVSVHVDVMGELHTALELYDKANIVSMKITGVLNYVDFSEISHEMPNLRYLDISDVDIEALPGSCFENSENVRTIILPNTLKTIQNKCFSDSKISGELIIPNGCEEIGERAFSGCVSLTSVTLPSSCKIIDSYAFYQTGLKSIIIPASCEKIWESAFQSSQLGLIEFEHNSSLKTIGEYAFYGSRLKSIIIPASCETIAGHAFPRILETVEFECNSNLKEIKSSAFSGCVSLTSIVIPAACETIERFAFSNCKSLEEVRFENNSHLKMIDDSAFTTCTSLTSITIPASCETISSAAFAGCTSMEFLEFEPGSSLTSIGGGAYSYVGCDGAFSDCTSLKSVTIPAKCETIGAAAFQNCTSLAIVRFEAGSVLKVIAGDRPTSEEYFGAFSDCTALKSITLPASCETIGKSAFENCSALTDLYVEKESKLSTIEESAFSSCGLLHRISMGNCTMIKRIEDGAFRGDDQIYFFTIGTRVPPTLSNGTFGNVGEYSALKVPSGSEYSYSSSLGWREFSSITAID